MFRLQPEDVAIITHDADDAAGGSDAGAVTGHNGDRVGSAPPSGDDEPGDL